MNHINLAGLFKKDIVCLHYPQPCEAGLFSVPPDPLSRKSNAQRDLKWKIFYLIYRGACLLLPVLP